MRDYPTRKDKNHETIDAFLMNEKKQSISLCLYGREIQGLQKSYPQVHTEKGRHYQNTKLFICTIRKVQ